LPSALKLGEWIVPVLVYYPVMFLRDYLSFETITEIHVFWQIVILLLTSEFLFYWLHRWSHENKTLWLFHAVHHGAERVYWANAGLFHVIDAFITGLAYAVPIALLGSRVEAITILLLLSAISGFLEHVNIQFYAGKWNYLFNTAELHRWHHSNEVEESNTNYGKVLIVWDLVFGTHLYNKDTSGLNAGVKGSKIPHTFLKQVLYPLEALKSVQVAETSPSGCDRPDQSYTSLP